MSERKEILLIDLSSVAHPIWHTSTDDPDPNATSTRTLAKVRAIVGTRPHVAVCCDSGKSFRAELDPTYKAQRPEAQAGLHHQIRLVREQLTREGFPVWAEKGFEADDVIATATRLAKEAGCHVVIASSDKDLLQLVEDSEMDRPGVQAMSIKNGELFDETRVFGKLGVEARQVRDYLTLMGDAADNIKGAYKVGEKTAAKILTTYQTIDGAYAALDSGDWKPAEGLAKSMSEFRPRVEAVRALTTLRTDCEIPFAEVFADRVSKNEAVSDFGAEDNEQEEDEREEEEDTEQMAKPSEPAPQKAAEAPAPKPEPKPESPPPARAAERVEGNVVRTEPVTLYAPDPVKKPEEKKRILTPEELRIEDLEISKEPWNRRLEPRSLREAKTLAQYVQDSHLFEAYGNPQSILMTIMAGREMGIQAMASLRAFHIIKGKPSPSASMLVALVQNSGKAEFFEPDEFDEKSATYISKRVGGRKEHKVTFTIDDAYLAWPKTEKDWKEKWAAGPYVTRPKSQLCARAKSGLVHLLYDDVINYLYSYEEMYDAIGEVPRMVTE